MILDNLFRPKNQMQGLFTKKIKCQAYVIENTLRLDLSMGPIGSGTKGTHTYSCLLYMVSIYKCRSDFPSTGCQFKKAQSAKTICIRGWKNRSRNPN